MTRENFTLTFRYEGLDVFRQKKLAPEILLVSALIYAFTVSISNNFYALTLASILPAVILCREKFLFSSLLKLNILNLFMVITLALTWPSVREGLTMGMIITLRLNMIYIVFASIIFPLGITGIYEALYALGIPEKLRVLIILTLRGIFVLYERLESALISVKLRAPNLHGIMKLKTFAYIIAGVLLQSSRRSERIMQAVVLRGGFGGFSQSERDSLRACDIIFALSFIAYAIVIISANYA